MTNKKELARQLADLTKKLEAFHKARKALAPRFMKAVEKAMQEEHKPFIEFLRDLDSTIPMKRGQYGNGKSGYMNHPTVRAADTMRRFWTAENYPERLKPITDDD